MQVYYDGLTNYLPPSNGFNTWFIMLSYLVVVLLEQFVPTTMLKDCLGALSKYSISSVLTLAFQ